jgi:hypothetical protein
MKHPVVVAAHAPQESAHSLRPQTFAPQDATHPLSSWPASACASMDASGTADPESDSSTAPSVAASGGTVDAPSSPRPPTFVTDAPQAQTIAAKELKKTM